MPQNKIRYIELEGEKIALKKGWFGYKVVHPYTNEDGSRNWFNLLTGGWGNLVSILFYIILALLIYFGVKQMLGGCQEVLDNPCKYCGERVSSFLN